MHLGVSYCSVVDMGGWMRVTCALYIQHELCMWLLVHAIARRSKKAAREVLEFGKWLRLINFLRPSWFGRTKPSPAGDGMIGPKRIWSTDMSSRGERSPAITPGSCTAFACSGETPRLRRVQPLQICLQGLFGPGSLRSGPDLGRESDITRFPAC